MRYSFVSTAAVLAFASSVFAQASTDGFDVITSPTNGQKVVAGKPFGITWVPGNEAIYKNGTATIVLLQGSDQKSLQVGPTIVAGVKNSLGAYSWNVPANAASSSAYGLRITLDDDKYTAANEATIFQYSFPFQIVAADQAGSGATTTIQLGTGTAYTPEPTSSTSSTLTIANSTTITSTSASAVPTNSSNFTLTSTRLSTSTRGSGPTATSTRPPSQTTNAAVANAVSGGFVLAGAIAALLL